MDDRHPKIVVYSSLFPHTGLPNAGVFIRERMFRLGKELPIIVVSPQPWFPGQRFIRYFKPYFRPSAPQLDIQSEVNIIYPKFFSFPGLFKYLDGLFMALGSYLTIRRLIKQNGFNILDAHFAYPDGYSAALLGRWLGVPVTITLRGTEVRHSQVPKLYPKLIHALNNANRIFSVSESLRRHAISLGIPPEKIIVVGNGVDMKKFSPLPKAEARRQLGLSDVDRVLISVGGLVERKGFHRVIEILPRLLKEFPDLKYLIVGGSSPEGDWRERLLQQVKNLKLDDVVMFLGAMPSDKLKTPLSAADIFVLATSNEGWANVFLEAMACGLPVVTTDVGGNREVVCRNELGIVVPYGDAASLESALASALKQRWDKATILSYASENSWDSRVVVLKNAFEELVADEK
ncbi:MAG: glycosyltransferase [Gammaproteobacteria bacterium]|nr:glycosyltransferase [Gammaproteobacteria bacterium]